MKNGIFRSLTALALGVSLLSFSSCASLLQIGEDNDPTSYDRGYGSEADNESNADENTVADEGMDRSVASLSTGVVRVKRAIETRDIILGMTRQDVMQSWGEPVQRDVAGNGTGGHERWTYGSRYKFNGSRTVIFENGRVAGWNR